MKIRAGNRSNQKRSDTFTAVVASAIILAILGAILVGLSAMKPDRSRPDNLVTAVPISQETNQVTVTSSGGSEPPVIYGINPIVVYTGSHVLYKDGVYVEDDTDTSPDLQIDNSDVDLTSPGTYPVTYIASDQDGNITRAATTVTVLPGTEQVSEEEIYAMADKVLESMIPDESISDEMKCLKVYEYLHAIGYVDEVHSEDWMQNAYLMLSLRSGDCFGYYSASRLLLEQMGYLVIEMQNSNGFQHVWCLVSTDQGETWRHFDPTCWQWGSDGYLCMLSDEELEEYASLHLIQGVLETHDWDRQATAEEIESYRQALAADHQPVSLLFGCINARQRGRH